MKDAEPYEIAWKVLVTMYKQFTQSRNEEEIDMAVSFARMALFYDYNKPDITNRLLNYLGQCLGSRYE